MAFLLLTINTSIAEGAQDDTTGKIVGKDGVMQF